MQDATGSWSNQTYRPCPRCTYPMLESHHQGARIDHCNRCGGSLIEPGNAQAHVGHWAEPSFWKQTLGRETLGTKINCPACHGTMTGFQVPWGGRSVVVDHCDTCGALWFDRGEAQKLVSIVQQAEAEGAFAGQRDTLGRRVNEQAVARQGLYDIEAEIDHAQDSTEKPGLRIYLFQLFTGMPVEIWNPLRNRAVATPALASLLVVIFVLEYMAIKGFRTPERIEKLIGYIALVPEHVLHGERLWGLVSHMFLHADIFHLLGNLYFLVIFGDNVEDRLGKAGFGLVFLLTGLVGAVLQIILGTDPSVPILGASGAVAGLMGAYLVLFPRVKVWMVIFFLHWRVPVSLYLGGWVIVNILGWYFGGKNIAWWAHIGGFAAGAGLGLFFRQSPQPRQLTR